MRALLQKNRIDSLFDRINSLVERIDRRLNLDTIAWLWGPLILIAWVVALALIELFWPIIFNISTSELITLGPFEMGLARVVFVFAMLIILLLVLFVFFRRLGVLVYFMMKVFVIVALVAYWVMLIVIGFKPLFLH